MSKERIIEIESELRKIEAELYRPREQPPPEREKPQEIAVQLPWSPPLMLPD
jgi:hypothetical protein